jgi:hypothetical protein
MVTKLLKVVKKAMWGMSAYLKVREISGAGRVSDLLTPEFVLDTPYNVIGQLYSVS